MDSWLHASTYIAGANRWCPLSMQTEWMHGQQCGSKGLQETAQPDTLGKKSDATLVM